jgi:AraC family ethanolamine operon transcriptional activator
VVRADEYTRANPDRLISIGELCTALSTSRRALQASFQEILGISPHAYIRAASLNAVRRQLKDPASPYQSVQDAAAAYGFWHMSQFARDYRQMFGEHPSSTLRRR